MSKTFKILVLFNLLCTSAFADRLLVKKNGQWTVQFGEAKTFLADPSVEWVEKDLRFHVDTTNDPMSSQQWSLAKTEVFSALTLATQQTSQTTAPILVAVVDTGVDLQQRDLKGNLFVNAKEIPNNGIDDDNNGFIDDVQGFNFAAHPDENDPDHNEENPISAQDDYNHGTHVAGILGAIQNNGIGIAGVAPNVKIMPLRWMIKGSGWGSDAIAAIRYAVAMGARVINASWGGIGYSKALEEAVRAAEAKGILFVVSAGNNKSNNDKVPHHPANLRFSNVISVANVDEKDVLAKTSNFGNTQVELAAPGENIISTVMNQAYGKLSGTSMAAPHVSGIAAMMLSVNPSLSGQEIKKILMETVVPAPSLQGKTITGGRVNALAALQKAIEKKQIAESLIGQKPFYEFGEVTPRKLLNGNFVNPDHVQDIGATKGLDVRFVRMLNGKEIPLEGITFKAQTHAGGGYQTYVSSEDGRVIDPYCQRDTFSVTTAVESKLYAVMGDGSNYPYDLVIALRCGVAQKIIFEEKSDGGEVMGIWQIAKSAEKKLAKEVGIDFWKQKIEFVWPDKGDFFDGSQVHLTHGHQWDVVSHEMGHAIYYQTNMGVAGGGEHYIDRCYDEALALSEGWASFYASWLNFSLDSADPGFQYMVPRRAPIKFENIPADVCGKSTNEWRVNGFLWDLIDTHSDSENFDKPFATLWNDTKGFRASSIGAMKSRLVGKGWDAKALESIWKLNFPAE